jgi:transcriptional regulator with XRE-family HTH domain
MPRRASRHIDSPQATGARIRAAREQAGLSQRQLSFEGCTAAYISRIEAGARTPSFQILRVLAETLDVSADFLATGEASRGLAQRDKLLEAELAAHSGDPAGARSLYEAAKAEGSVQLAARADLGLARLALDSGDQFGAVGHLEAALASGNLSLADAGDSQALLGRAYALLARFDEAASLLEGALREAEAIDDDPAVLRFSVLLANTLIDRGSYSDAEDVLGGILGRARASSDPVTLSQLYWSQSRLHASQGRSDLAAHYARLAHASLAATEHRLLAARALVLLAHLENDRGNARAALELVDECHPKIAAAGNQLEEGMLVLERARAMSTLGENEEAASIALGAIAKFRGGHPTSAGRGYAVAAGIFRDLDDREKAIELYELAAETLPVADRHLVDVYRSLATLHEERGTVAEQIRYLKLALEVQVDTVQRRSRAEGLTSGA